MKNQTNAANPTELATNVINDPLIKDKIRAVADLISQAHNQGNKQNNWLLIVIMVVSIFSGEIREFFLFDQKIIDQIEVLEERIDTQDKKLDRIEQKISLIK